MSCECYKIGGPWIAEDPNCPAHGIEAQRERERQEEAKYEQNQEMLRLRGQITYLQEELASVEDTLRETIERFESRIAELEQQAGYSGRD